VAREFDKRLGAKCMPETEPARNDGPDRRRERRPVALRGYIIPEGGVPHVVELVDLNYGGCGIRTPVPLVTGERVKLTVDQLGSIPAEVRWYKNGRAGIDFSPSDDQREQVDRNVPRIALKAEGILRARSRSSYRVPVRDLSLQGCQVEFVERPREGDKMSIKFFGLEALEAEVCWVERSTAGLMFTKPIHPAVFDLLLKRLEVE
jgi:hypothetical protein